MREQRQKILIVEDEPILRQGLEILGDWGKNGLVLIGSVQNGREALELMDTELPDIIITDIMMPVLDGIELIKRVKIQYPEVEIIVLSNYSDFQYVKQAMKAGAADYLLKAQIDFDSLLEVVNKIGEDISQRKRLQEDKIPDELEIERSAFLKRLLFSTEIEDKEAEKSAENLGIKWSSRHMAVCAVEFFKDNQELRGEEKAELLNRIHEYLPEFEEGMIHMQENMERIYFIAVWSKSTSEALCEFLKKRIASYNGITFRMAAGTLVNRFSHIPLSRASSERGLSYCFYLGKNTCFDSNRRCMDKIVWSFDGERLRNACIVRDVKVIMEIADDLLKTAVSDDFMDPYDLFKSAEGILHILMVNLRKNEENNRERMKQMQYFRQLEECSYYDSFCEVFRQMLIELTSAGERDFIKSRNPLFLDIFEYVNMHIEEDMSLKSLAEEFHVNYSYLSQMFKTHTGTNFSSYLNQQRIQKAVELLKEGRFSVADVGDMVGYHEVSYFCKVFRKYTGKTPSDIQKI